MLSMWSAILVERLFRGKWIPILSEMWASNGGSRMSDLIDRKDLGAAIDNWLAIDRYYHPYSKQKTIPVSELVDIIKLLPSAQPEIVRCGECTHRLGHD